MRTQAFGVVIASEDFANPSGQGTVPVFINAGASQHLLPEKAETFHEAADTPPPWHRTDVARPRPLLMLRRAEPAEEDAGRPAQLSYDPMAAGLPRESGDGS